MPPWQMDLSFIRGKLTGERIRFCWVKFELV
jgi:hypothetical protein